MLNGQSESRNMASTTTAAAKSKERPRQFHVVPVPAVFTRGRWECRDFKDATPIAESQILDFTEKQYPVSSSACNLVSNGIAEGAMCPLATSTTAPSSIVQPPAAQGAVNFIIGGGTSTGNVSDTSTHLLQPSDVPSPSTTSAPPPHSVSMPNAAAAGPADAASVVGNVVAIDNKIEQAMDLVKTHLTFAVREEVEILRSTIADLEARVANLEGENQVLRQYAPEQVVANLPHLMQNEPTQQHKHSLPILHQHPLSHSVAQLPSTIPIPEQQQQHHKFSADVYHSGPQQQQQQ